MDTTIFGNLRDRMMPLAAKRQDATRHDPALRGPRPNRPSEIDRALHLAAHLFGVGTAVLVEAGAQGFRVDGGSIGGVWSREDAIGTARKLFEALNVSEPTETGIRAGVLEEIAPHSGFRAAAPILAADGRRLGAICLLDQGRKTLLTALQRRLLAEFGDLVALSLARGDPPAQTRRDGDAACRDSGALLQDLADRDPEAFAIFDRDGRCLLRNRRFGTLLDAAPTVARLPSIPAALGREAAWLALGLARDIEPVGIYRVSMADGTWLRVEERRGPHGSSLLARVEARDAFGGDGEMRLLFDRCPLPMFVYDRETRSILVVNASALALYGWDRDAFLRLPLDALGPLGDDSHPAGRRARDAAGDAQAWIHRTRAGTPVAVSGRSVGFVHRGRAAVLVTVTAELA